MYDENKTYIESSSKSEHEAQLVAIGLQLKIDVEFPAQGSLVDIPSAAGTDHLFVRHL